MTVNMIVMTTDRESINIIVNAHLIYPTWATEVTTVFNDDYQQMPLPTVAARAFKSALWLGEDVLRRSVPLPNQIRLKA